MPEVASHDRQCLFVLFVDLGRIYKVDKPLGQTSLQLAHLIYYTQSPLMSCKPQSDVTGFLLHILTSPNLIKLKDDTLVGIPTTSLSD